MTRKLVFEQFAEGRGVVLSAEAARLLHYSPESVLEREFFPGDRLTRELADVSDDERAHLDAEGLVRVGADVRPGMILVGRVTVSRRKAAAPESEEEDAPEDETPPQELDRSLRCSPGLFGTVVAVDRVKGKGKAPDVVRVTVRRERPLAVGDLLSIDGHEPRVFLGTVDLESGVDGRWPGPAGEWTVKRVAPEAADLVHARSIGPYSLVTQQPLGGREQFGGQVLHESQALALIGRGAITMVHECLTLKSDDVTGRVALYESLVTGEPVKKRGLPHSVVGVEQLLRAMAFDVELTGDSVELRLMSDERVVELGPHRVTKPETLNYRTLKPEKGGLFCEEIFGSLDDAQTRLRTLGHLALAVPLVHPWAKAPVAQLLGVDEERIEQVMLCERTLDGREPEDTDDVGGAAVARALAQVDLDDAPPELAAALRRSRTSPASFCLTKWPVLSPELRPLVPLEGGRFATSDLNDLYRRVINRNNRTARLIELNAPAIIIRNEVRMLQQALGSLLDNRREEGAIVGPNGRPLVSLVEFFIGQVEKLATKRVDYSGVARAVFDANLHGRTAIVPRSMARELLRPRLYRWLEAAGHVSTIKAAKNLVTAEAPQANDALEAIAPTVPLLLTHEVEPRAVGVDVTLGDADAIVMSREVFEALGLREGDVVIAHVPVSDASEREVRSLGLDQLSVPSMPATGWLGRLPGNADPAPLLLQIALSKDTDPLTDRLSRLMLGRLAT
ncbi:MAG: hypothetical protein JNM69_36475 [Archangium sp.]|nr:hypothetical protein [Archangium sp.]